MRQAVVMAHDIGLFKTLSVEDKIGYKMQRARAFTAWCLYAWDSLQSFYFKREVSFTTTPEFRLPEYDSDPAWYSEIWVRYPLTNMPWRMHLGQSIYATMQLRFIMHDIAQLFFGPRQSPKSPRFEQLLAFRGSLDQWFSRLPEPLAPGTIVLPSHFRIHIEYYSTLITTIQAQSGPAPFPPPETTPGFAGRVDADIIVQAYTRIETLVRLYYIRHNCETYDALLIFCFLHLGNRTLEMLRSDSVSAKDLKSYHSTLMICAQGLHDQGRNSFLSSRLFFTLRDLMEPREKSLLMAYFKD
jgi:hypothetical protein